jgi:hypothetical protein
LSLLPLSQEQREVPAATHTSLSSRYRQILHGVASPEYAKYRAAVPRHERQLGNPNHPLTPRAEFASSRRAFRQTVSQWRHDLHRWDALDRAEDARAEGLPTLVQAGLEPPVRPDSPALADLIAHVRALAGAAEEEDEEAAADAARAGANNEVDRSEHDHTGAGTGADETWRGSVARATGHNISDIGSFAGNGSFAEGNGSPSGAAASASNADAIGITSGTSHRARDRHVVVLADDNAPSQSQSHLSMCTFLGPQSADPTGSHHHHHHYGGSATPHGRSGEDAGTKALTFGSLSGHGSPDSHGAAGARTRGFSPAPHRRADDE